MIAGLMLFAASSASAQTDNGSGELPSRIGPEARAQLVRIIDSARTARLPTTPLFAKSAEGVLKGADDERIVNAVRKLAHELGEVRVVMPDRSGSSTLMAAASAYHAGASLESLRRLAKIPAASDQADASLDVALISLADLMASRVPSARAVSAVEELMKRRATPEEFDAFRAGVSRDVNRGGTPEKVIESRLKVIRGRR